jgi:hypothetical protein
VDTIDFTWTYLTNDGAWYDPPQYAVNGVFVMLTQQNNATGSMSIPVQEGDIFTFRQYSTDSCCQPGHLTISNLSLWNGLATTTTTVPDTTIPDTTTTIQETTTSWETTTTSTTTTTTTSTIAPSTTVDVTPNLTTTTLQTIATPLPEPTMPEPPPTVPLPQIEPPAIPEIPDLPPEIETFPPETLNLPPEIVDTMPFPVDTYPTVYPPDTLPFVGELPDPPDTMPLPPDTLPDAPETLDTLPIEVIAELPPELVEALLDAGDTDIPLTEEQFDTVVDTIENLAPEEAVALITQILATAVTADQAEALASNPDVLAVITEEQATEIFETIEVAQLDETQIAELTAAIQDAPLAVQEAFEQTIDIFGGFDDYVPTGSNIPVGERRTLIAIAAGATLTAASTRMKR